MIKQKFSKRYPDCKFTGKRGYKLSNLQCPAVFSADCVFKKAGSKEKRCDEIIFCNLNEDLVGLYLVERKKRDVDPIKIKLQLNSSAAFIDAFLLENSNLKKQKLNFMPILVSRGIPSSMRNELRTKWISLSKMKEPIEHVKIGGKLPKIVVKP